MSRGGYNPPEITRAKFADIIRPKPHEHIERNIKMSRGGYNPPEITRAEFADIIRPKSHGQNLRISSARNRTGEIYGYHPPEITRTYQKEH